TGYQDVSSHGDRINKIASNDPNPALQKIDLATKIIRTIALTQLAADDWPRGITWSNDDKMFCTTKGSLWSFDPRSESLTKIRDAPSGANFWRVAFDPQMHATFATTGHQTNPVVMFR